MTWCCMPSNSHCYPWCYPYGGCYNGHPYYTQFQTMNVSPKSLESGTNPSAELTQNANNLTSSMYAGFDSCGEAMNKSSELSCDAYQLGQKFQKFTTHFSKFSCEARKFMGNILYPDFEAVRNPKPIFDDTQVWEKMNCDFERHVGNQEFLMIPPNCRVSKLCPCPLKCK